MTIPATCPSKRLRLDVGDVALDQGDRPVTVVLSVVPRFAAVGVNGMTWIEDGTFCPIPVEGSGTVEGEAPVEVEVACTDQSSKWAVGGVPVTGDHTHVLDIEAQFLVSGRKAGKAVRWRGVLVPETGPAVINLADLVTGAVPGGVVVTWPEAVLAARDAAVSAQAAAETAAGQAADDATATQDWYQATHADKLAVDATKTAVDTAVAGIAGQVNTAVTAADVPGKVATAITGADIPGKVATAIAADPTPANAAAAAVNSALASSDVITGSDPRAAKTYSGPSSKAIVERDRITGRISRFVDRAGATWLKLRNDVLLPGAQLVAGSVPASALAAGVLRVTTVAGTQDRFIIRDPAGRYALRIKASGLVVIPKLQLVDGSVSASALTDGTVLPTKLDTNTAGRVSRIEPDLTRIVGIGDSLTDANVYLPRVAANLGLAGSTNFGKSGWASADIATRFGGLKPTLTLDSGVLAASGSTTVTALTPSTGWRTGHTGSGSTYTWGGYLIAGGQRVPGSLVHDHIAATWVFTRSDSGGAAIPCPNGAQFVCTDADALRNQLAIIFVGRNNIATSTAQDDIVRDVKAIHAALKPLVRRCLVIGPTNQTTETSAATGSLLTQYQRVVAINAALRDTYPQDYFDLRTGFIRRGLTLASLPPTTDDTNALAVDAPPPSLMSDTTHPNTAGYTAMGDLLSAEITLRGLLIP